MLDILWGFKQEIQKSNWECYQAQLIPSLYEAQESPSHMIYMAAKHTKSTIIKLELSNFSLISLNLKTLNFISISHFGSCLSP